ncbi:MAG: DUF4905 domain-containing protein [Ignavibacteriota bacterium]|nr:MAG: DUF4905 domain-containing protein [Chlorobiota bacterium]MBE7476680.1 DUF4905 domain-containing protein [Ignavibacteriales bacterium]MBL1122068.1 DUF4905 domain-containing protein [Ignavibacteriota bacterium]MCC7094744.1 DUF4905 domain-containing protein [Ignavibacteriaceae bacterium]MCE7857705.1 DUF4905 domain-containing protein [Ignavibacteria bacterium CHB3]MEB2297744.1 DUF4905 domain-containing protein [Ignavibacteria bacterium]
MKLKKKYRFDNKRQIWRIIPTNSGKLIIEERESEQKQVYFHCIELTSGKKILQDFQLDDKFWVGIESVKDDYIYFHKFAKPDMPKHKGIFAFDIKTKKIFWENSNLTFQFMFRDKMYAYVEEFGGKKFFALNLQDGTVEDELGDNPLLINELRDQSIADNIPAGYLFPEVFSSDSLIENNTFDLISSLKTDFMISGQIEYLLKNGLLMMSFHTVNEKGKLNNIFKAVDLSGRKYILEEVLNKDTSLFFTDSFFVKDDFLFLLFGKTRLEVYNIIS